MSAQAVEIVYKCHCMSKEASIGVPFRRPSENVVEWMQSCVSTAIYLDHRRRASDCRAAAMEYAKIQVPENAPSIGARPEVN